MTSTRKAFTLVELLVVVGMIALLMGALTVSVAGAQKRAKIEKARSDVKIISQAILASENYSSGGGYKLDPVGGTSPSEGEVAGPALLRDLIGQGRAAESGGNIPALLLAALRSDSVMYDPWGRPYRIQIKAGSANVVMKSAASSLFTGYFLPNFYRLSAKERQ